MSQTELYRYRNLGCSPIHTSQGIVKMGETNRHDSTGQKAGVGAVSWEAQGSDSMALLQSWMLLGDFCATGYLIPYEPRKD